MYIYEIIVDGFKSYAQRTVIGPFDQHFNAITGLNGSGKSNILDSICFVLGITSWGQLRASSMQDLIYKQGTAGIEQASVSIVFNNEDESKSPTGYEKERTITVTRQIKLGGRHKFLINGRNAQQAAVLNLFQSVQLNIANPHFLIMQGHIAKVLNMKPLETLSMLEEASGTRMFEAKKLNALKTIEQKDSKVEDINKILDETITPKLEKLRSERTAYKEYLQAKTRVEEDTQSMAAFQYALARQEVMDSEDPEVKFRIQELEAQLKEKEARVKEIEKIMIDAKRKPETSAALDELEKAVAKLEKELHALNTKKARLESDILSEVRGLKKMEAQLHELEASLSDKQSGLATASANVESTLRLKSAADAALSTLQHGFATSDSSANASLEGQLIAARQSLSEHQTALSKFQRQLELVEEDLAAAKKRLSNTGRTGDYGDLQAKYDLAKSEATALERELRSALQPMAEEAAIIATYPEIAEIASRTTSIASSSTQASSSSAPVARGAKKASAKQTAAKRGRKMVEEDSTMDVDEPVAAPSQSAPTDLMGQIEVRQAQLHAFIRELRAFAHSIGEEASSEAVQLESTQFRYSCPKSIKEEQVQGQVCKLVTLKHESTATALTIAGGGRWHHVVVDSQSTAKALLSEGKLARRTTFVPLDTVTARPADLNMAATAQRQLGASNVSHAQTLVTFPKAVEKAVSYALGDTLICKDSTIARKATFEQKYARSVTLDGDFFDRRGTLTGGQDASNRAPILAVLHRQRSLEERLNKIQEHARVLEGLDARIQQTLTKFSRAQQESVSLEQRLSLHPFHAQTNAVQKLEAESTQIRDVQIPLTQRNVQESTELVASLEAQMSSSKSSTASKAKSETAAHQKAAKEAAAAWRAAQQKKVQLESECEEAAKELADLVSELDAKRQLIASNKEQLSGPLEEELRALNGQLVKKQAALDHELKILEEERKHLEALTKERNDARDAFSDARMEHHKLSSIAAEAKTKAKKSRAVMDDLARRYPGIDRDNYAGQGGRSREEDIQHFEVQLDKLKASIAANQKKMASLSRSINTKASAMLDSSEREYDDLQAKKKLIENDRASILRTIQELEAKKLDTLKKTYAQVSRDFTSIFSTLLPGASAKIMPVDGSDSITDGLVVKVDLNNNYSTHLSELSGGQKSLLALSLVLSLLRYNPAPMYILDEIDAALDLSHTQNIGTMLKTHFSQSQFIIVSLKEGMFNNANVLFKTRFELGISRVDRFTTAASSSAPSRDKAVASSSRTRS
jgi:structural maintenance of chromosome 2